MAAFDQGDDPFGWYSGLETLRSRHDLFESSVDGVWSEPPTQPGPSAHEDLSIPSNRYARIALIGQGGMGKVWLGRDNVLDRHVAIKEPRGEGQLALQREATLTAKLDHPSIVKVFDIYRHDGIDHFVMQIVDGVPLGKLAIEVERPISHEEIAPLVRHVMSISEAIAHAHDRMLLHGDLSPRNILITKQGTAHVIDWGLARSLEHGPFLKNVTTGTPGFIAPEVIEGEPVGRASDVWSLGALLYMLLEGQPPPDDLAKLEFGQRVRREHRALVAITRRCLEGDPARRYADARALTRELEAWFEGRRLLAYSPSLLEQIRDTIKRYKAPSLVVLISSVLLLGSVVLGTLRTRQETTRALIAEERAKLEAQRITRLLVRQHITSARRALDERDTHQALASLSQGLELADHPELRGLAMQLLAIDLPSPGRTLTLPECQGRWMLDTHAHMPLCIGPGARATLHDLDGRPVWTYEPRSTSDAISTKPRAQRDRLWHFVDARFSRDHVLLLDNARHLHSVQRGTGTRADYDQRVGSFASRADIMRLSQDRLTPLHQDVGPNPCDASRGGAGYARRSKTRPTLTHYICQVGGPLYQSDARDGRIERLMDEGSKARAILDHGATGALLVGDQSNRIHKLGEPHPPLMTRAKPMRLLELDGAPWVLVQDQAGHINLFDPESMTWRASLPSAQQVSIGPGGEVWLIRQGRLEQWRVPTHPRRARYAWENGFSSVSWSSDGSQLGALDGSGFAHILEPLKGESFEPVALTTQVAKAIAPEPDAPRFHAVTAEHGYSWRLETNADAHQIKASPQVMLGTAGRRVGILRGNHLYLITYKRALYAQRLDAPSEDSHRISVKTEIVDVSVSSDHGAIALLGPDELLRIDADRPLTPTRLAFDEQRNPFAVALREDRHLALLERERLTYHDERGVLLGELPLEQVPQDAAWHPEQPWLFVTFLDGSMNIYEERDDVFSLLGKMQAHQERVSSVSIQRQGKWAASASWDGTLALYDIEVLSMPHKLLLETVQKHQ